PGSLRAPRHLRRRVPPIGQLAWERSSASLHWMSAGAMRRQGRRQLAENVAPSTSHHASDAVTNDVAGKKGSCRKLPCLSAAPSCPRPARPLDPISDDTSWL